MTQLHIAEGLDLPDTAVTETFAILAKRGMGKTSTGVVLAEELLAARLPVCVLDPTGVWWGLRSSADGQDDGLPVVIFGGEHADVPLLETAGEAIANAVVDDRLSAVLDLSLLRKNATRRFATDFLETLYRRNRLPLHLIVDEADLIAPQRVQQGGERLLGAAEDVARRGRVRGLGSTWISQRPAVLHKGVLSQAEVLICLRLIGKHDVEAVDDWVRVNADPEQAAEVKRTLASLPVGRAWVWSPGWLELLEQVQIRPRRTFDSSATPKPGEQRPEPVRWAPVDLALLGERVAAAAEQAQADDPKTLRERIRALEDELTAARRTAVRAEPTQIVEYVDRPVLGEDGAALLDRLAGDLGRATAVLRDVRGRLAAGPAPEPSVPSVRPLGGRPEPPATAGPPGDSLPRAQRLILTALAQLGTRTRTQVSLVTGYSGKSSGFRNALSSLRTAGYLEGSDPLAITAAGRVALGTYPPLPSGAELRSWWESHLGRAERLIFGVLLDEHPHALDKPTIADRTGYSLTSSGFRNALSRLRSFQLISQTTDGNLAVDADLAHAIGPT